jgi:hypothetical protein
MTQEVSIREFQLSPDNIKQEIIDFFQYVQFKYQQQNAKGQQKKGSKYIALQPGEFKSVNTSAAQGAINNTGEPAPIAPSEEKPRPYFGCGKYKITLAPDFDEPLEDFKEYME